MKFDSEKHHRRSIRLKNFDYSCQGAYFITIVTHNRECLFCEIINGQMQLNEWGEMVRHCWLEIPKHFQHTQLDEFVIMPNHIHGIIWIVDNIGARYAVPLRNGSIIDNTDGARHVGARHVGAQHAVPQQFIIKKSR